METCVLRTDRPHRGNIPFFCTVVAALGITSIRQADAGDRHRSTRRPADVPAFATPAERGDWLLRHKPYLPPDFDQITFDMLWAVWPEPLRSQARDATPAERRRMTFSHYGLIEPPESARFGFCRGW